MRQRRSAGKFFFQRLLIIGLIIVFGAPAALKEMATLNPLDPTGRVDSYRAAAAPRLPDSRRIHILYGDDHGGGHLHGVNRPCKSEFPADWSEKDIVASVKAIAANDNLGWQRQKNGNVVADTVDHGVKIRVVLNSDLTEIVTAYPLSTPRNACPAANDNEKD
jgi:hypothetical protein